MCFIYINFFIKWHEVLLYILHLIYVNINNLTAITSYII
jgi:hypothetical protein